MRMISCGMQARAARWGRQPTRRHAAKISKAGLRAEEYVAEAPGRPGDQDTSTRLAMTDERSLVEAGMAAYRAHDSLSGGMSLSEKKNRFPLFRGQAANTALLANTERAPRTVITRARLIRITRWRRDARGCDINRAVRRLSSRSTLQHVHDRIARQHPPDARSSTRAQKWWDGERPGCPQAFTS